MDITKPCEDVTLLDPYVQVMLRYGFNRMAAAKVRLPNIIETLRTQDRQNYLYCQGRGILECVNKGIPREFATKYCNLKAKKVTWTLNSKHRSRHAVDVVPVDKRGNCIWNGKAEEFDTLIYYMQEAGFTAGALWKQKDYPHFQVDWNGKPFGKANTPTAVVELIQRRLNAKLHTTLSEDGVWGNATTEAVKQFNKQCKVLTNKDKLALKAFTELLAMQ